MLDKSLFVSDTIHERKVALADGTKHKMYFKELPHVHFRQYALDNSPYEGDPDDDAAIEAHEQARLHSMARLVCAGLTDKNGASAITFEQAKKLKPGPLVAIFNAIQEVNSSRPKKTVTGASGTS